jgi:hypothetical protein
MPVCLLSLFWKIAADWCVVLPLLRSRRLYPSLDALRPLGVSESIPVEAIQVLHALIVRSMHSLGCRVIVPCELDFALRAHTKVWRLGDRVVRLPHVHCALELSGGVVHEPSKVCGFRRVAGGILGG